MVRTWDNKRDNIGLSLYVFGVDIMAKCVFCNQEITKEDLRDEICDKCWDFEVMPDKVDLDYEREELD